MAALALSFVGAAAGSAVFVPTGAIAGRLIGALAGNFIDQALFGRRERVLGPKCWRRLQELQCHCWVIRGHDGASL